MNKLIKLKVLVLFLLWNITFFAQRPHIKFEHISLEDGLSQSSALWHMCTDNKGFMWFATLDGLNKYDGYTITVYSNKTGDSTSISDNVINCLYVDQASIWRFSVDW
jgi:two-component system sensor histidine kinase ChiS